MKRTFRSVDAREPSLRPIIEATATNAWDSINGELHAPVRDNATTERVLGNTILFFDDQRILSSPEKAALMLFTMREFLPELVKLTSAGTTETFPYLRGYVADLLDFGFRGEIQLVSESAGCTIRSSHTSPETLVIVVSANDKSDYLLEPLIKACLRTNFVEVPSLP
ncbi:MAG: hypothetical protein Q7R83_03340 [bacterium]|nr:hypothetical protein [bacterium]